MIWQNIYRMIGGPYDDTDIESEGEPELRLATPERDSSFVYKIHKYRMRESSNGDMVYVYAGVHGIN